MEKLDTSLSHSEPNAQKPLLAIWACFAVLDGFLLFLNEQRFPQRVSLLFPLWAFVAAVVAVAYSDSLASVIRRAKSMRMNVPSVFIAVLSGATIVIVLRQISMTRLSVPDASPIIRCAFIAMIVLLVPLAEEVLFRGIILDRLLRGKGVLPAILISSLAAALCHQAIVPAFFEHLVIASIYVWRGESLWASLLTHVTLNTAALLPGLGK